MQPHDLIDFLYNTKFLMTMSISVPKIKHFQAFRLVKQLIWYNSNNYVDLCAKKHIFNFFFFSFLFWHKCNKPHDVLVQYY
jgi:hypothetical protein